VGLIGCTGTNPLVEGKWSYRPHRWHKCADLTQVRPTASLRTMTTFPRYCPLWSVELHYGFVLKRRIRGWREEGVFKMCLTSTPKQCATYWVYRNRVRSEQKATDFFNTKFIISYYSINYCLIFQINPCNFLNNLYASLLLNKVTYQLKTRNF